MKRPIDLRKKSDGRHRANKWWKASAWDSMVRGTSSLPGGIAAWLPSVCFILISAHLEARKSAAGGHASEEVRKLMAEDVHARLEAAGSVQAGGYELE
eukprot:3747306-Pleurochrysis_carterae.AAC.1